MSPSAAEREIPGRLKKFFGGCHQISCLNSSNGHQITSIYLPPDWQPDYISFASILAMVTSAEIVASLVARLIFSLISIFVLHKQPDHRIFVAFHHASVCH